MWPEIFFVNFCHNSVSGLRTLKPNKNFKNPIDFFRPWVQVQADLGITSISGFSNCFYSPAIWLERICTLSL